MRGALSRAIARRLLSKMRAEGAAITSAAVDGARFDMLRATIIALRAMGVSHEDIDFYERLLP